MKRRETAIGLIFLILLLIYACGRKEEAAIEKPDPVPGIRTETVRLSAVEEMHEAVGTVRSKTTSVLSSKAVGHILSIHVREGDRIREGQLLVEVDDRDSRAQLLKARAGLREVQEGLREIEENIRSAESAGEAAEAGKSLARVTFHRYQSLLEEKSVSQQEFDEVRTKLKIAEAEADRAERMLRGLLAKRGQILAKVEQVKADITSARVYVGYSRITSPINGLVTAKHAEIGSLAAPGLPLLTVEDNLHYRLEASVEDSMLKRIKLKAPVLVSIDALGPQKFSCKVMEIVPASDPGSRSSTVKIDLLDGKGRPIGQPTVRSGLFGKAFFPVGQKRILMVPLKAILQHGQLASVFILDESNILRLRLIKTGKPYEDRWEVLSGLNEGDRIVVEGVERVKEGDRIQ
jgi:multidrug efflux pump subunit AcrA (membrane-fusion protein)